MGFRGASDSKLLEGNFSIGSIIREGKHDKGYLVIGNGGHGVRLLNLTTFRLDTDNWIEVEDPHYISNNEARELISEFKYSFSDYDYIDKGLKDFDI